MHSVNKQSWYALEQESASTQSTALILTIWCPTLIFCSIKFCYLYFRCTFSVCLWDRGNKTVPATFLKFLKITLESRVLIYFSTIVTLHFPLNLRYEGKLGRKIIFWYVRATEIFDSIEFKNCSFPLFQDSPALILRLHTHIQTHTYFITLTHTPASSRQENIKISVQSKNNA